jgi:hypothetical protein
MNAMTAGVVCDYRAWEDNCSRDSDGNYTSYCTTVDVTVACADVNTGLASPAEGLVFTDPVVCTTCLQTDDSGQCINSYTDPACLAAAYNNQDPAWFAANIQPTADRLRRPLLHAMPLFDMQAMIDTLYFLANGTASSEDLTAFDQRIPIAGAPSLCLDVVGGTSASGTPLQLSACNGSTEQTWVYDRHAQTITAWCFDKCLDVRGGSLDPGTPAQIWDCNGTDSQRWTYDPEQQVLANALGNKLAVQGPLAQGSTVWTWPSDGTPDEQWKADPFVPCRGLRCLVAPPPSKCGWTVATFGP